MDHSTPGFLVLHDLPEFAQTHVHWINDVIQPSHSLLSPSPLAFSLSQYQGLFQWVGSSIRWPQYWSFSSSISPSNEYSVLISFRIAWFVLLTVQGTLTSLLQHYSLKASMANLDSILKSRDVTLPTKTYIVKATVFPVVMYECESWTIKKAEH